MAPKNDRSILDMTMEKMEERRREVERNYEEFFAAARDGFYISTQEGEFLDCNDALVKMLGYRVTEEVLCLDLVTDLWMNPWDRTRFQAIIEQQGYVRDYRAVFKRKDGTPLYVTLTSHVWTDNEGNIRGYRGFVVDRTEGRVIRQRLRATEIKYRDLFESINDGVFISETDGSILDCNRALCGIVGYSREDLSGMNFYRDLCVSADDVMEIRKEFKASGTIRDYEVQIVRKDGAVRDVSINGYSTKNAEGRIIAFQWLMRDITEPKRLRQQLIRSERLSAMGKMASQLAHELNNPIFGIMNCLEMLRDALPREHVKRRYVDLAYNECKRTSGLLIKMLKFFKPDEERKSNTDINVLLEETLLFYEKQFKNLNITVTTDLEADLPRIQAVGSQLKQVFINMIINANTAMPKGGELHVASRLEPDEKSVAITIRDTGVGISQANLDRIFDAFFTTKKEVKGVGIGLSICYGFIRDHGGRIDVESEPGKGTLFTIYLPVNNEIGSAGRP